MNINTNQTTDMTLLTTNEKAAAAAAAQTDDAATGLLLVSMWGHSAAVMSAMSTNERLSPGARERAAEKLAAINARGRT